MKLLVLAIITLFIYVNTFANQQKIEPGRWIGSLELNQDVLLKFEIQIKRKSNTFELIVLNGKEIVPTKQPIIQGDSIHIPFLNFNTELVFKIHSPTEIRGFWQNHIKGNYQIPFYASKSKSTIFPVDNKKTTADFSGKWKTVFSPSQQSFDAIAIFEQDKNKAFGTFLTETGDFRYLAGNISHNELRLSGFDGSHAFLFTATMNDQGTIYGNYYSGKHYQTNWIAERNSTFELRNSDSLTYVVGDPYNYSITATDLNGNTFEFPNAQYKGKTVIIQIMGTWCANCMDETLLLTELYDNYHQDGLEIITIGYEVGESLVDYRKSLQRYQERYQIKHLLLSGGNAQKSSASQDFNFLNQVSSFPTTLFIDKTGKIVKVHSGFSGPGTGKYYLEYKAKIHELIQTLLFQ